MFHHVLKKPRDLYCVHIVRVTNDKAEVRLNTVVNNIHHQENSTKQTHARNRTTHNKIPD